MCIHLRVLVANPRETKHCKTLNLKPKSGLFNSKSFSEASKSTISVEEETMKHGSCSKLLGIQTFNLLSFFFCQGLPLCDSMHA